MRRNRNHRIRLVSVATALLAATWCSPSVHGQADPFGEAAESGAVETGAPDSAASNAAAIKPTAAEPAERQADAGAPAGATGELPPNGVRSGANPAGQPDVDGSSGYGPAASAYGLAASARSDNIAELLGSAMMRNPDIAVAEAKVRSAQVELDRTRLDVSRQIIDAVLAIRHQRKVVDVSKVQLATSKQHQEMLKRHAEKGIVSTTEVTSALATVGNAELALAKAEAQLETAVASLDYLTGRQSMPGGGMGMQDMMGAPGAMGGFLPRRSVSLSAGEASRSYDATGTSAGSPTNSANATDVDDGGTASTKRLRRSAARGGGFSSVVPTTATTFHDRLRTKLSEPTTLEFIDVPLGEVMSFLDDVHGITNIVIDRDTPDDRELTSEPITLKLENVPLSAALKAIEDIAHVRYVVTAYGLRVTTKEVEIEESTPLREFLRPTATIYRARDLDFGYSGDSTTSNPFAADSEPAGKDRRNERRPAIDPFSAGGGEAKEDDEAASDASIFGNARDAGKEKAK